MAEIVFNIGFDGMDIRLVNFGLINNMRGYVTQCNIPESEYNRMLKIWNDFFELQQKLKDLAAQNGYKFRF